MQEVVRAFASGDSAPGLSLLKENGTLRLSRGGPAATKQQLVSDWLASDTPVRERLILTTTNAAAYSLNSLAHEARREAGELGAVPLTLSTGEEVRKGDRVLFGRTHRGLDVSNGETGTVLAVHTPPDYSRKAGDVTVELDHGREVRVDLDRYAELSRGYALTTHKAQGATIDEAFVYTRADRAARDMVYVQTSRARNALAVYVPGHDLGEDLQDLERAASRDSTEHTLALEIAAEGHGPEREEELRKQRARGFGLGLERER